MNKNISEMSEEEKVTTKEILTKKIKEMQETKVLPTKDNPLFTTGSKIWVEDGIIMWYGLPTAKYVDKDLAQQNFNALMEVAKLLPQQLILTVAEKTQAISLDARKLYSSATFYEKAALITDNPTAKILGSFFVGLNKNKRPINFFTSIEEAKKWLKEE